VRNLFLLFFFLDKKERKNQALAARRPFTASRAKTAILASLKQPPFLRSLRPKGPRLRSLGRSLEHGGFRMTQDRRFSIFLFSYATFAVGDEIL